MAKVISHKLKDDRFEQLQAEKRGNVLIELELETLKGEAQRLVVEMDRRLFQKFGLKPILEEYRLEIETSRIPVLMKGKKIGSLPATVSPDFIRSTSWFYGPRRGDLKRNDDHFEINPMLGDGDIEAIAGFVWERT